MLERIIPYSFYLLFFLTPLFWTSLNYELFEYNKMILTYGFTLVIVGAWLLKMIDRKSLILNRTPLDIPLLLFLAANILSTIFSMDTHTSIWGYYSRSNGGLLSLISYLLLYFAFVSNMNLQHVKNILKFALASGFLISIWAIFEHFGVSVSCVILRGEFNDGCWIQDVQARVFASLGQPNWLAAYLAMLIFPALYFLLSAPTRILRTTYYILLTSLYLAFTFTYSRGPTLGLIGGMLVFIISLLFERGRKLTTSLPAMLSPETLRLSMRAGRKARQAGPLSSFGRRIILVFASFLIVNILFGSALTSFRLVSKFAAPTRPGINLPVSTSGTQLENGGTESGQIRFIVWQGALEIFKHNPIFGSGLETFAYSYYQYRPASHNLTSEWDFLYNKAHNEYLNYLSTTGIVGFGTYMTVIVYFVYWCTRKLVSKTQDNKTTMLTLVLLSSYISYLIYNFFLFSVVIVAIFFYLFPALAFVATGSTKTAKLFPIFNWIYHRPLYTKIAKGIVIALTVYLFFCLLKIWSADTIFNKAQKALDSGNSGRAYNLLITALDLNPNEPFYRSELAYSAAASAVALNETDATLSASLKNEALLQLNTTLEQSPENVSFWRSAIRTYFELVTLDKKYIDNTLSALDYAILLAPTDPKLYYNKALVLQSLGKEDEAIANLQQALRLKPNYLEVQASLNEATKSARLPDGQAK